MEKQYRKSSRNGSSSETIAQDAPKPPRKGNARTYGSLDSPNTNSLRSPGTITTLSPITPSKIFSPRNEIQQLATMLSGDSGSLRDSVEDLEKQASSSRRHRKNRSTDENYFVESKTVGSRPRATSHDMGRRNSGTRSRSSSFSEERKSSGSRKGKLSRTASETYRSGGKSSPLFEPQASIREDYAENHRTSASSSHKRSDSRSSKKYQRMAQSLDDTNLQKQERKQERRTRSGRERTTSDIRGFFPAKVQKYTVLPMDDDEEANQEESWVQQQPPELVSLLQKPTRRYHLKQMEVERYMSSIRGEIQPRKCNDIPFAILFYAQFAVIAWLSSNYGINSILLNPSYISDVVVQVDYKNIVMLTFFCGLFASGLSGMALLFMTLFPGKLMQIALILSVSMSFIWGTFGIGFFSKSFVPASGIVALMLTIGYTFVVWDRIPFASTNVFTALSLIKTKRGVYYPILFMEVLMLIWTVWWAFAFLGVYDWTLSCDVCREWFVLVVVSLCISYYWTYKVIVHVIQVMIAGVIGEAWFDNTPTPNKCCAKIVTNSFLKATFFSFGSICLGSLIVAPLQIIHQILKSFIPHRSEDNVLLCLQECLLVINHALQHCCNALVHYVNSWAFTFVGLYGYSFLESGHMATTIFEARGWTKISNDALLTNVIFIFNIMIGGCTGVFAFVIEYFTDYNFTSIRSHSLVAFIVGFFIGLVSSGVLLSVVHSSVDTIIALYATTPLTLEMRYPILSDTMHMAWEEVWPGFMNIDIFKKKATRR